MATFYAMSRSPQGRQAMPPCTTQMSTSPPVPLSTGLQGWAAPAASGEGIWMMNNDDDDDVWLMIDDEWWYLGETEMKGKRARKKKEGDDWMMIMAWGKTGRTCKWMNGMPGMDDEWAIWWYTNDEWRKMKMIHTYISFSGLGIY